MRSFGLVGLLLSLACGYFVLQPSVTGPGQGPPQEQIDVIAIRQRLLTVGHAERQYLATHGSYASLEQLRGDELLSPGADPRGYTFSATASGNAAFTVTATPADPNKTGWPTLEINETMQVTQR